MTGGFEPLHVKTIKVALVKLRWPSKVVSGDALTTDIATDSSE